MEIMKQALKGLLVVAVMLIAAGSVAAQPSGDGQSARADAELMTKRYTESYDSLLNSYYLRRHAHRSLRSHTEFSTEAFDALPDSVLMHRLQALHTVIPMTYNTEVRSFIRFYLRHMSSRPLWRARGAEIPHHCGERHEPAGHLARWRRGPLAVYVQHW